MSNSSDTDKSKSKWWIIFGLIWGAMMFSLNTFILNKDELNTASKNHIITSLIIWLIGGLIFGWIFKQLSKKQK